MKTNNIKLLTLFVAIGIILFSACKKEETHALNYPENPKFETSVLGFFNTNVLEATQTFTIDANVYQSIIGAKGTKLYFQPNIFRTPTGAIAMGNITIELIEIQSKADMILLNKTTTSNGKLLESAGELSIKAFQNGSRLTMISNSSNQSIYVQMPSVNPINNNMILFAGKSTVTEDVDWTLTGLNGPNNNVTIDSSGKVSCFWIGSDSISFSDSLGWINIDRFANGTNNSHIIINTPPNYTGDSPNPNTVLMVFFQNIHSVCSLTWNTTNGYWETNPNYSGLPIGEPVKIIAMSVVGGQFYSSIIPMTISAGLNQSITLTATTAAALKNDLNNL